MSLTIINAVIMPIVKVVILYSNRKYYIQTLAK